MAPARLQFDRAVCTYVGERANRVALIAHYHDRHANQVAAEPVAERRNLVNSPGTDPLAPEDALDLERIQPGRTIRLAWQRNRGFERQFSVPFHLRQQSGEVVHAR